MEYKILNTEVKEETTTTRVEYNIEGNIVIVDVAHFRANEEMILLGISNRYTTEMYKLFPERMPPPPPTPTQPEIEINEEPTE